MKRGLVQTTVFQTGHLSKRLVEGRTLMCLISSTVPPV